MAYLALYRTYRPSNFNEVVGQKHIIRTIQNQIKSDLLSHAYIFSGPRGTGKTSIARIIAKAINCENQSNANPCNNCPNCIGINKGSHPDVFEMDGASNNGVDEIREVRDKVKYSPSMAKYKVYIIDEVHMLSTGAFNALLKTLEEPPAHAIFLLATTEVHKIPDTILSRTQHFDLKQIPTPEMKVHLERILHEQQIPFEQGVSDLIATLSQGGLRDALSMLDQAIAYKKDTITIADIHDLNGTVDQNTLIEIINSINDGNFAKTINATKNLLANGKIPARILDGLLTLLRDILKVQKIAPESVDPLLIELSQKLPPQQTINYIMQINQLAHGLKIATDAELILEIGLIELGMKNEENPPVPSGNFNFTAVLDNLTTQIEALKQEVTSLKNSKSTMLDHQQKEPVAGPSVGLTHQQETPKIDPNPIDISISVQNPIQETDSVETVKNENPFLQDIPEQTLNSISEPIFNQESQKINLNEADVFANEVILDEVTESEVLQTSVSEAEVDLQMFNEPVVELNNLQLEVEPMIGEKQSEIETTGLMINEELQPMIEEIADVNPQSTAIIGANEITIESVLNVATKEAKQLLVMQIDGVSPFQKIEYKDVIMLLKDSEIVAASEQACILVYDYEATVKKILTEENKRIAGNVLLEILGKNYSFLALPKDFWQTERNSYLTQKQQGRNPVLNQYSQIVQNVVDYKAPVVEEKPFYQEIVDSFGEGIVEIED